MIKGTKFLLIFLLLSVFMLLILLLSPCPFSVCAESTENAEREELEESIEELLSELDVEELQEYLQSLDGFSEWNAKDKIVELLSGGTLNYDNLFSAVFSELTDSLADMLPAFAVICAISLLCGVLNGLKGSFLNDSTGEIIFFVCYSSVAVVLFSQLIQIFTLCNDTMNGLKRQMEIIFPVLFTLMAASGGTVSVGVYQPAVAFLCDGVANMLVCAVMPFTAVIIVLSMVGKLNQNVKLNGFISLFKSVNKWLIGISVTVFGIFLTAQGLTSATYDGVSLRAAKYAISNSVPIVGNFISGGFDIVLAGNILIKNSVGMIGVFLILAVSLQPVLFLAGFSLFLRLTAAISEPIGDERIAGFLTQISEGISYVVACLVSLSFLYFLTILLLICSAGVFV